MSQKSSLPQAAKSVSLALTPDKRDRKLGLAWSDSNFEAGISSVAAPVFDYTGEIAGGINVSGATSALEGAARRREIGAALANAAQEISRRIGYLPESASHPARM